MSRKSFYAFITHIAGWFGMMSLPLLFMSNNPGGESIISIILSYQYWLFVVPYVLLFYFHTGFLFPKLYLAKKKLAYFATMMVLLAAILLLRPFDQLVSKHQSRPTPEMRDDHRPPGPPPTGETWQRRPLPNGPHNQPPQNGPGQIDIVSIFLFIMTIALSITVQVTQRWRQTEERASQAEADKANAELSFLKAQINPHFLFNTLNNIYSLAVTKNEHTANSIMKLSNIMRYVTDDINEDYVSLQSEVDCISDYIDLHRLRLGKKVTVDFSVSGDLERKSIEPLILMTFIENLFKYGVSNHEASTILIKLFADEKAITFFCQNRLFAVQRKAERTGIGLVNTKKRLKHLYPNKHFLDINTENNLYTVQLTLQV